MPVDYTRVTATFDFPFSPILCTMWVLHKSEPIETRIDSNHLPPWLKDASFQCRRICWFPFEKSIIGSKFFLETFFFKKKQIQLIKVTIRSRTFNFTEFKTIRSRQPLTRTPLLQTNRQKSKILFSIVQRWVDLHDNSTTKLWSKEKCHRIQKRDSNIVLIRSKISASCNVGYKFQVPSPARNDDPAPFVSVFFFNATSAYWRSLLIRFIPNTSINIKWVKTAGAS